MTYSIDTHSKNDYTLKMQIARSFDNMQHAEMFTTNLFCSSHSISLHAMIFHILSLLQLQVNWGIFVLFDPLRRVGLMYINVFWYIVYHPVYKQRTKRHGGAIFFNISDTIGISLSMCGSVLVQLFISREIDSFADDTDLAVLFVFFISFCD